MIKKSFLLNLNYEDWRNANQFARERGFKSFTQFIEFAIKFTIDSLLLPDDATPYARAASRTYYKR